MAQPWLQIETLVQVVLTKGLVQFGPDLGINTVKLMLKGGLGCLLEALFQSGNTTKLLVGDIVINRRMTEDQDRTGSRG